MAYKLELHLVVKGDKRDLEKIQRSIQFDLEISRDVDDCEFELAGGLVEITDGEENSEGVPDGK